jgi:hypothetical protein
MKGDWQKRFADMDGNVVREDFEQTFLDKIIVIWLHFSNPEERTLLLQKQMQAKFILV